jgi:hypothetical protein
MKTYDIEDALNSSVLMSPSKNDSSLDDDVFFQDLNEASYKTRLRYVSMSIELLMNALENSTNT